MNDKFITATLLNPKLRSFDISESKKNNGQEVSYNPDHCHVIILNSAVFHQDIIFNRYYKHLPFSRQKKIEHFRFRKDKNTSLAAGILLHHILSIENYSESDLSYTQYGKPYLISPSGLHFNLSHTHNLAVIAFYTSTIGVDVEAVQHADFEIAKTYFSEEEKECIREAKDSNEQFYNYWVLKESYLKARGTGLNAPLNSFSIRKSESLIEVLENNLIEPYFFELKQFENFRLAVCIKEQLPPISYHELSVI
ncbi:4'-phosphopantetheinyl transferase superfamily protein [Eubacteriaceae bacterium ES3]|nr:4'-phosphopantetheinyl transferase superfamily protein [Eubacteriaceae bacterium ES3]